MISVCVSRTDAVAFVGKHMSVNEHTNPIELARLVRAVLVNFHEGSEDIRVEIDGTDCEKKFILLSDGSHQIL